MDTLSTAICRERRNSMQTSHVTFHSKNGKRLILIADDEQVNRELLGFIAESNYEVLYASNGRDALDAMKKHAKVLSLVLLDLNMPEMGGFEVTKRMMEDDDLRKIPVLVLTSEEGAEVDCLKLGASDFIIKPFRAPEVVMARMQKTIELNEDRSVIEQTEREELTGLYIKDFFFNYAKQYDLHHTDLKMDALAINVNNFHLINELYGRHMGDIVLGHMGEYLKSMRDRFGVMACRSEADQFLVYAPSGAVDYDKMAEEINAHFESFQDINVHVRSGIYQDVDKTIEMERRFDRAVQAENMIEGDYNKSIAYYDASIHQKHLDELRLMDEFDEALEKEEFQLYFQPKYNIDKEEPELSSAEVLIRWNHAEKGMISPGVFIPLFENNGLIQRLDFWIWKRAIEYMAEWKEKYGKEITLSINISRVDLYNKNLIKYIDENIKKYGVSKDKLYLEITESAYSEDTDQLMGVVEQLREDGYKIEMDDFGTGYSSLAMLAQVPVDVIKMDMLFVRGMQSNEKRETIIKLVMDIAESLGIRTIAEGVEDKETVDFLKSVGCNTIQGYYFSKPLPEEEFVKKFTE